MKKQAKLQKNVGHGDLSLWAIDPKDIPEAVRSALEAQTGHAAVMARGEKTGHAHEVTSEGRVGFVRVDDSVAYLLLEKAGLLDHTGTAPGEGHGQRRLAPGAYIVPTERDYDPLEYARRVVD